MRTDHDPFAPPPFSDTGEQKITMDSKVKLTGEMKTPRKPKAAPKPADLETALAELEGL